MIKKFLSVSFMAFCLICCQTKEELQIFEETFPVCFTLQLNKSVLPFPGTKTIPPLDIDEPVVGKSGAEKEITDFCTITEYVVYKEEDLSTPLKHIQFTVQDEDYGIIYDRLPVGKYKIVFLSHSAASATVSGTTCSFDKLTDTFHSVIDYEVTSITAMEENITLHRIVCRIEFESIEPVPDTQKSFSIEINPYPDKINIVTGAGIPSEAAKTITHAFSANEYGTEKMRHDFYTFIASDPASFSVKLTATDSDDAVTCTHTLATVTPIINKIIRYTGTIYLQPDLNDSFFLDIYNDGTWDEEIEKTI